MENPLASSPLDECAFPGLRRKRQQSFSDAVVPSAAAPMTPPAASLCLQAIFVQEEQEPRITTLKRQRCLVVPDPAPVHSIRPADSTSLLSTRPSAPIVPIAGEPAAAASAGTTRKEKQYVRNLKLDLGSFYVAKRGVHPRGEDAHFMDRALNAFGVADGVGGWTDHGIDAGEFSRELMSLCNVELVAAFCRRTDPTTSMLAGVLERALERTTARGTSTACIAVVDGQLLRTINIGDSGFLVVRRGKVHYSSPPQQSSFNRPYQVGRVDQGDSPARASRVALRIAQGDIIVAGTDGLFDNLSHEKILELLAKANPDGHNTPEEMAKSLARAAVEASETGDETPFSVICGKAKVPWSSRGKPDDVTVVVASVW